MIRQETAKSMLAALKALQDTNWKSGEGCHDKDCFVCLRNRVAIEIAEQAIKSAEEEMKNSLK